MQVLYVDDEPDIREIVLMGLQLDPEMEVRACASGQEALEVARQWRPDVILLDVMMPGMDGPMTLDALRATAETASLPVIYITARARARELAVPTDAGVIGIITKPFDPITLAGEIRARLAT